MSEENNNSNYDLSREEINDELDKLINEINEGLDKSTEDEILPDDTSILCYSIDFFPTANLDHWKKLKGSNKDDEDDSCPPPPSNDNHDDNSEIKNDNSKIEDLLN